jgi:hypothetical protein
VTNPTQRNGDGERTDLSPYRLFDDVTWPNSDALGDPCDPEPDNDTLFIGPACGSGDPNEVMRDTDGDLHLDAAECALGSAAHDFNSRPAHIVGFDLDGDGVPQQYEANDQDVDADGDGVLDRQEFRYYNTNLLMADTDADGCSDAREIASVNGDRHVNVIDLQQVATAAGSYTLPGTIVQVTFDVVKSGDISVIDLLFVAQNLGTCPPS